MLRYIYNKFQWYYKGLNFVDDKLTAKNKIYIS